MSSTSQLLFSGAVSGFASSIFLQPFDLLKTRIQQEDLRARNVVSVARDVIHEKGPIGLWRGTSATVARAVPGVALYFTSLTKLRSVMATSPYFSVAQKPSQPNDTSSALPKVSNQGNLIAGALARSAVGFILNPLTLLKARYESNFHTYGSLYGALTSLVRAGPSEMFRGYVPAALRDAPYAGLFVAFYETIKSRAAQFVPVEESTLASTGLHSFSAASAGAIATLATHPFDVVKTKMQVRPEKQFRSVVQTVADIIRQRGLIGFFDGASLRMSRKVLSSAISWAVYEGMVNFTRTSSD